MAHIHPYTLGVLCDTLYMVHLLWTGEVSWEKEEGQGAKGVISFRGI